MSKEEQTLEQTLDVAVESPTDESASDVSVDSESLEETPLSSNGGNDIHYNYLGDDLFKDIKRINVDDLTTEPDDNHLEQKLLDSYLETISDISENQLIKGRVIGMNEKEILIDIGFKSEGIIDRNEFSDEELPKVGETLEVYLEYLEDRTGRTVLSKEKADFMRRWKNLREFFDNETIIEGTITKRIKGGMAVDLEGVQAFLPGSQIDLRPVRDFDQFVGKTINLRIVKLNEMRKNIVVSHKVIMEESMKEQRDALFEDLDIDQIMEGRVKNITDFGAFIDLGGIDVLLHITDLTWGRVGHPSEVVSLDDSITVKIIDYDREKQRISLGLKQLTPHPWEQVASKYPEGTKINGKVVSMKNYGAFVELEPGVEGLIHVSEMSWTRHVKNPSEIYSMNDDVEAVVLGVDADERKISLGIKQLQDDPWDAIEDKFTVGDVSKGKVINLTQFGAFVELEEGIEGLVHISDLSWTKVLRHPKEIVEKDQEIEVRILEVSRENRRISLGLKHVQEDPWPDIIKEYQSGKEVSGEILHILEKGIILKLENGIEGIIPFSRKNKKDRKELMGKFEKGGTLKGVVMEVRPDDKKIVLLSEEIGSTNKEDVLDDVQSFLKSQDAPAGEKIEIPQDDDSDPIKPDETDESTEDNKKE